VQIRVLYYRWERINLPMKIGTPSKEI